MSSRAISQKEHRGRWQASVIENLEWIIEAVILAVIIRCFVLEAFVIPTGSMAPTFYGRHVTVNCPNCNRKYDVGINSSTGTPYAGPRCPNCGDEPHTLSRVKGGDKILVNKAFYQFSPIQRWDIIVFKSPENIEKNLIKRVVGLPNEELAIVAGNLLVAGRIVRKPPLVQEQLWMLVHDGRFVPSDDIPIWSLDGGWQRTDGGLEVESPEGERPPSFTRYLPEIRDFYAYYPNSGRNMVGDLKLTLRVTPRSGNGALILEIAGGDKTFRCRLPVEATSPVTLEVGSREVAWASNAPYLCTGVPTEIEFSKADFLVRLKIKGKEVLSYDCWPGVDKLKTSTSHSGIRIGSQGLSLLVEAVMIHRDIYYLPAPDNHAFQTGENEYVMFGDSCPNSGDSRRFGLVPRKEILGKALVVWWPLTRMRLVR